MTDSNNENQSGQSKAANDEPTNNGSENSSTPADRKEFFRREQDR